MRSLFVCLALAAVAFGQNCDGCDGAGVVPCTDKQHDPKKVCGTLMPHRCDVIARTPCCRGTLQRPCNCGNGPELKKLMAALKAERDWSRAMGEIDKKCATKLIHVQTEHFLLRFSPTSWKARKKLTRVHAAHLFAERLEAFAKEYEELFGVLPKGRRNFFVMRNALEMATATEALAGVRRQSAYRLIGMENSDTPNGTFTWPSNSILSTDKGLWGHLVHLAAHDFTNAVYVETLDTPAWFHVGLAKWMETRQFKRTDTYCLTPYTTKDPWLKFKDWSTKITKEVRKERFERPKNLFSAAEESLTLRKGAYCWSLVDFIIKKHKKKLPAFLEALKTKGTDAALAVLKLDPARFQKAWVRFVRRGYR